MSDQTTAAEKRHRLLLYLQVHHEIAETAMGRARQALIMGDAAIALECLEQANREINRLPRVNSKEPMLGGGSQRPGAH